MNYKLMLISVLVFLVVIAQAMAVSVSVGDVSLSKDNAVERSNPLEFGDENELDDQDELKYVRFSIPVTATDGEVTFNSVTPDTSVFTYDPIDNDDVTDDDFIIVRTGLPFTLNNQSGKIDVDVLVPSNLDSIDTSFDDVQHSLNIAVGTSLGTQTSKATFYAENGIELDDIEVIIDGDKASCDIERNNDCDDEVEEISPTADVSIIVTAQNIFDKDSENNFEDVEFEVESDNRDAEPQDDSDEVDIDADQEESLTFDFDIDTDLEDGDDAKIEVRVSVVDQNGARHGVEYTFDMEFELPEGKVDIQEFVLTPASACPGDVVRGTFGIQNKGSDDQDNVRIQINNENLRLDAIFSGIDLDDAEGRDADFQQDFAFRVADDARDGVYQIRGTVYYEDEDNDDTSEFQTTPLTVLDCNTDNDNQDNNDQSNSNQDNNDSDNGIVVTQPTTTSPTTQPTTSGTAVAKPVVSTRQASNDAVMVGVLVVLLIVLALVVLYLIFALAKHR